MGTRGLVIAIDGPAASGKSTTARLVAERLGYLHIDTGAMYRAVTAEVLRNGLDPGNGEEIAGLVERIHVRLMRTPKGLRVLVNDVDVTDRTRLPEVTAAVSAVSSHRAVRRAMAREQRLMGAEGGVVLEGRDIGTVVFPDADLKFFMIAGIDARAERRRAELEASGARSDIESLRREIEERDRRDSTRTESPLRRAEDAIVIDTSGLTIDQQVDRVISEVERRVSKGTTR